MRIWKINYADGGTNTAIGESDIWTGLKGVSSVEVEGEMPTPPLQDETPVPDPIADLSAKIGALTTAIAAAVPAAADAIQSAQLKQ